MNAISRIYLIILMTVLAFPGLLTAQDRQFSNQAIGGETAQAGPASQVATDGRVGVQINRVNGNQVINADEGQREIEIVVRPNGHISVNISRQYGPDEHPALLRRQPELEEYIKSFPQTAGGSDVQLTIRLTSRFEAPDEASLREKDIAAYNLFRKYRQVAQRSRSRFERLPSVGDQRQIGPALPDLENRPVTETETQPNPAGGGNRGN